MDCKPIKKLPCTTDKDSDHRHLEWDIRHNTTTGEDYAVITGRYWYSMDNYGAGAMDIMPTVKTKGKKYTVRRVGDGIKRISSTVKPDPFSHPFTFDIFNFIKVKSGSTPICIASHAFEGVSAQSIEFTDASFVTIGNEAFKNVSLTSMDTCVTLFSSRQNYGIFFNTDVNDRDKLYVTIGDKAFSNVEFSKDRPDKYKKFSNSLQTSTSTTSSYNINPSAFNGSAIQWIQK